ncbi:hypothetical protein [Sphaerotilus sp.]|uniref:hypothetical protein n=1 Tax=Sphaerotilus sp. TaxID=2093942 RepID=UPI002ACD6A72|nr:hypothetical protein [Sphaerotilus sp.]MDZ7855862.1 hypothetical protein [Sphaerotilus sp.]
MHTTTTPRSSLLRCRERLRSRWERLHIDVRCALHAGEPARIRQYLHCGHKLAALGAIDEVAAQAQMLQTLLHTARDAELPNFWRSACLELTAVPLLRLRHLIGLHDPLAMQAIEAAVNTCARRLPLPRQHLGAHA